MEDTFSMQVYHTKHYVLSDLQHLLMAQFVMVLMQLIEQTAHLQEFCYQTIPIDLNAHTHIQHDVRMPQIVQYLDFLKEILETTTMYFTSFEVGFNGHVATTPLGFINCTIATLSYSLNVGYLVLRN